MLGEPFGSRREETERHFYSGWRPHGTPTEPPTLTSAVRNWSSGDTIPLGRKTVRVVRVRNSALALASATQAFQHVVRYGREARGRIERIGHVEAA
jgi:hypothetical protein